MASKRSPRTRTETQQALNDVRREQTMRPALGRADLTEQRRRAAMAVEAVKGIDLEKAMTKLTSAGLDVQKLLGQIQGTFAEQYAEVQTVQQAVEAYRAELEQLYGKDVILSDLNDLLNEHDRRMAELEQDFRDAEANHQRQVTELSRVYNERRQQLERDRNQEETDFRFRREQTRRTEEAEYNERRREQERELNDREFALSAREQELENLKAQVAGFEARLKSETERAVAIATNSLKKELTNTYALERKDLENQLNLEKANSANLQRQVKAVEDRNADLQKEVAASNLRITEISKAAMESTSGQRALGAVQEYAATQGNAGPAGRRG